MTPTKRGRTRTRTDDAIGITRTLDRGLALLEQLGIERQASLSHLARSVGITPTTASRLLETLKLRGMVDYEEASGLYSVGMKLFVIGSSAVRGQRLDRLAMSSLRNLAADTGLIASLAVRNNSTAVYVEQVEAAGMMRITPQIGRQLPLHATAAGKVLTAWLWEDALDLALGAEALRRFTSHTITERSDLQEDLRFVRDRGWATDDQEFEEGLFCIASPVRDRSGDVVAALSVSSLSSRVTPDFIAALTKLLVANANETSAKLGWSVSPPSLSPAPFSD